MGKIGDIYVKAFIFLQLSFTSPPILPNPGEIDECLWTSIDYIFDLENNHKTTHDFLFFPCGPKEFISKMP